MAEVAFRYCPRCATALVETQTRGARRPTCPACGFIAFRDPKVVVVVVIEHAGRVLLQRRAIDPARGQWSFVAGYVDQGEALEAAATREVREETALDLQVEGPIGVYSAASLPHILIAYRATATTADLAALQTQAEEVSELRLFAPDDVPDLAFPFDPLILADWRRGRRAGDR